MKTIISLKQAVESVMATFAAHPERDRFAAEAAAREGRPRPFAALTLNHLSVPDDTDAEPPHFPLPDIAMPSTPEGGLARELLDLLRPLEMDNPIAPCLDLGAGTGTLPCAFGIPLDLELGGTPAFTKSLDALLREPPPDTAHAGLMPAMLARIDLIKAHLPPFFKIALPDMQGPYNIAHAIAGEDALTGPYIEPEAFAALMERVTTHFIESRVMLMEHIGPDYACPVDRYPRIAECSVNLVSAEIYREHILPHDRRIVEQFGPPRIHTCSGPHVFQVTLECLPLVETECGYIPCAVAGYTDPDEGESAVRGKPILLNIGQEVPKDFEAAFELIRRDLDRHARHPRLTFAYTGMEWRRRDRAAIRALHARLDDYWSRKHGK